MKIAKLVLSLFMFIFCFSITYASADIDILVSRPYSVKFIDEMSSHHKMGVEMGMMAMEKAYHSELRMMGKMMAEVQQREIDMMEDWRRDLYPSVRSFRSRDVGMNMARLESLRGNAFDLAFLDSMISHHPAAIYLGQEAMRKSEVSKIRALGKRIRDSQIKELNKMRAMRDKWTTLN